MIHYESNQAFYDDIDSLLVLLEQEGYKTEAKIIDQLLHRVAWTTSSELLGELRSTFERLVSENHGLPKPVKEKLNAFIATIDRASDRANGKL